MRTARKGPAFVAGILVFLGILLAGAVGLGAELSVNMIPRVEIEQSYTDNFFLEPDRRVGMLITRVAPGFKLRGATEDSLLLLDYLAGHYWHFTDRKEIRASELNFFRHDLALGVATQPSVHWRLGLTDELVKSRAPLLTEEGVDPGLPLDIRSNLIDFTRNRVKPFVNLYLSGDWEAKAGYQGEIFDLSSDNAGIDSLLEDQVEHRGAVNFIYNLNSTNHLDLENQFWHRDFSARDPSDPLNSDYSAYQTKLLYRRNSIDTPYAFEIGAGHQFRGFSQRVNGRVVGSFSEFIFSSELSRKTSLSRIGLSLERTINDFTINNNYYVSHAARLTAHRYLRGRRFRLFGKTAYELNDYLTNQPGEIERRDNVWELEGGIACRFWKERIELTLGYAYADRNSNDRAFDYQENRVFLKIDAKYDLGFRNLSAPVR